MIDRAWSLLHFKAGKVWAQLHIQGGLQPRRPILQYAHNLPAQVHHPDLTALTHPTCALTASATDTCAGWHLLMPAPCSALPPPDTARCMPSPPAPASVVVVLHVAHGMTGCRHHIHNSRAGCHTHPLSFPSVVKKKVPAHQHIMAKPGMHNAASLPLLADSHKQRA